MCKDNNNLRHLSKLMEERDRGRRRTVRNSKAEGEKWGCMAWFVTSRSENLDFHTARLTSAAEKPIAISTSGENVMRTSFPCQSSDRPQLLPNTDAMLKPSNERKLNAWRTKQLHGNAMLETIANN